jgi:transcriptional regulator GlxA family with amidase domain
MSQPNRSRRPVTSGEKDNTQRFPANMRSVAEIEVCALALDGVVTFDLACATQAFARGPGREGSPAGFTLTTCGARRGRVPTVDGFDLRVDHGLEAVARADIVVVPGRYPHDARPPEAVLAALRAAHDAGTTIVSVCVGAFVLAHAGLLDGRPATTHWGYCDDLAATFPQIEVRPEVLFVDDGDVLTSAGLAAGLDLCLHVVRREAGAATAARLAAWNVVAPHRDGGQAQFIPPPARQDLAGSIGATLAWAHERLHEPLTLARLAQHACMSERTFSRRFLAEVGTTPKRWLLAQRVGHARDLLESTDAPVELVAAQAGFPSAASLRTHLRRHAATTPSGYRRTFRARSPDRPVLG